MKKSLLLLAGMLHCSANLFQEELTEYGSARVKHGAQGKLGEVAKMEKTAKKERQITDAIAKYDEAHHPKGETLHTSTRGFRVKTINKVSYLLTYFVTYLLSLALLAYLL